MKRFRSRGPKRTTRWLIDALADGVTTGSSLLDIGGGVGEIQHELASHGVLSITNVDASSAYQERAREEAEARGYLPRADYRYGDFVQIAPQVDEADIVALDRVICCYDDVDALVGLSSAKARRLYGVVFPRSKWWTRVGFGMINLVQRLRRASFRAFLHSPVRVEQLLSDDGFYRVFHRESLVWRVSVYRRNGSAA
ncbi:MAG: methyltransferase domain-containing protein [Rhodothermales bacterium]|nr:methyltransferase domain-containing protein [Rhodothermales bacterium]